MGTSSPIDSTHWRRSLHLRIVVGFILCIAAVLGVQTLVVLWLLNRAPDASELDDFTHVVSSDLTAAIAADPGLSIERYVTEHYKKPFVTLFVVMASGESVSFGPAPASKDHIETVLEFLRDPNARRGSRAQAGFGATVPALPQTWVVRFHMVPVYVRGQLAGLAGIEPQTLNQLIGWRMAAVASGLLIAGTTLAALLIVGPVRRRLHNLERAARRFGAGDFAIRAEETGVDEVAALARAFNGMAEDLSARDEQLRSLDRTRRMLLADVSHELMTPLTAIRGHNDVLSMSPLARDPDAARSLAVLRDETRRVEHIVGDLLDLARLEARAEALKHEDVSVENLFGRVVARHERQAKQRDVQLRTVIESGAELLYGDSFRLEQALQNLAANGLRHTPDGGVLELHASLGTDELLLSVRDSGSGIPAEHLPHVFDRFYKVDPARVATSDGRSGLGLSIVKAIAERHGGGVFVTSELGVATTFTIRLPLTNDGFVLKECSRTSDPVTALPA